MRENRLKVGDLIMVGNKVFIARIAGAAISTALLILILLSACTPAPTAAPTLTATVTLPPPTATNVPPTPTVTPVPTQSPEQAADALGLRSEPLYGDRDFSVREINGAEYLVDQYNGAPKAVKNEDGTWRRLDYADPVDAEVMYGDLVPAGAAYIDPEITYSRIYGPHGRDIATRLLGDWEVGQVEYEGRQIDVYYLLTGLRDGDGGLHIVRVTYDSPDIKEHWTTFMCYYGDEFGRPSPGGGQATFFPLVESLAHLRVGEAGYLTAYEYDEYEQEKEWESPDYPLVMNTAQERLMIYLYNSYPDKYRLTAAERAALDEYRWPERVVTLAMPGGVAVQRDSEDDCYR